LLTENKHAGNGLAGRLQRTAQIDVYYTLSYSTELNPEDQLNGDLKQAMGMRASVRTKAKLREAANEHMTQLEGSPVRVRAYFQDPVVK
jgi:hypothetical protein